MHVLCPGIWPRLVPWLDSVGDRLSPLHRFLSMLEEEIYGANSPIWESGFTMPPSEGTQLVPRPGMCRSRFCRLCLAFLAELSPCGGRGTVNGSSGDMQEGSPEGWRVYISFWGSTNTFDPCPPILLSATVSAAVVPSAPIFSPTMGGGSNSSLSLDSGGAEPMPGGYLTPDL